MYLVGSRMAFPNDICSDLQEKMGSTFFFPTQNTFCTIRCVQTLQSRGPIQRNEGPKIACCLDPFGHAVLKVYILAREASSSLRDEKVKYLVNFSQSFCSVLQLLIREHFYFVLLLCYRTFETSSFPFNIIHQRNISLKMAAELAPKHDPDRPPCPTVWLSPNSGLRDCRTDCENATDYMICSLFFPP